MVSPAPEREKGLGAGETEACLSNYIWLQMSNNGELLDMDLDLIFLGVASFQCLAGQVGSEQECSQALQIGNPVSKYLFRSLPIFMYAHTW